MTEGTSQGIIVGATREQEWLLPWWWMHFALYNSYPVTFVDFGDMSERALQWCSRRGNVIKLDISDKFVAPKEAIDVETAKLWEKINDQVWIVRKGWFKKPFALLRSPYKTTIWLDLDCQVRASLQPLFELNLGEAGLTLAPEADWQQKLNLARRMIKPGEVVLNSGVIVYDKQSPIIQQWADQAIQKNHLFFGDQQLLVHVLFNQKLAFLQMNRLYNWQIENGISLPALIFHWSGRFKNNVKAQMQFLEKSLFINLSF